MTTTHDDNATTWRDLADALTPKQIAYIEDWERHPELPPMADGSPPRDGAHRAGLLFTAQEFVKTNAAAALYADVPAPPDATFVDDWMEWGEDDSYSRSFGGTKRVIDPYWFVDINGVQYSDGRIERTIRADTTEEFNDGEMTAAQARLIAAAIIEAADELDREVAR